jgi:hypothetical protein
MIDWIQKLNAIVADLRVQLLRKFWTTPEEK